MWRPVCYARVMYWTITVTAPRYHPISYRRYCSHLVDAKSCMDWDYYGDRSENCYEMASCAHHLHSCMGCVNCWGGNSELFYCDLLSGSRCCLGCISLKSARYCVMNRQYSEREYRQLLPRIIEHMRATDEWGEFFPMSLSPFSYNETVAQDYHPLAREQVLERGLAWAEERDDRPNEFDSASYVETVEELNRGDISKMVFACEASSGAFRLIRQEIGFYEQEAIAPPRRTPNQRYIDRMARRNPRSMFARQCSACGGAVETSYSPERPVQVYCEPCYLRTVV